MTASPPSQRDAQVLIAGAGPTGLVLGLLLARQGIRVRIVDPLVGWVAGVRVSAPCFV